MSRLLLVLLLGCMSLAARAAVTHLLIVTGLPGEPVYGELFAQRAGALKSSAEQHLGIPPDRVTWLAAAGAGDTLADGLADRASVLGALHGLVERSRAGDRVVIVLIGHGTARDGRALFNLPGPDLAPADLAAPLDRLVDRRIALVDTSPGSAPFVSALSAPGRVLISATGSSAEDRHTLFADPFIAAFADDAADADKDGLVSLLEAFNFANHEIERRYAGERRLRTEHALLEDDGDGRGSDKPGAGAGDGELARRFHLAEGTIVVAADTPTTRLLEAEARDLLIELEALRSERVALPAAQFDQRLEGLLVRLAVNRRALRAGGAP